MRGIINRKLNLKWMIASILILHKQKNLSSNIIRLKVLTEIITLINYTFSLLNCYLNLLL